MPSRTCNRGLALAFGLLFFSFGLLFSLHGQEPPEHGHGTATNAANAAHATHTHTHAHTHAGVTNAAAAVTNLPPFIALGEKTNTVDMLVVATFNSANYGMNFNGYAKGGAAFTVPTGWTVNVTFRNNSPVPHSVVVVEDTQLRKLQFKEPYFEGGATPKFTTGSTNKDKPQHFQFVADESGDYAFACGFPAHTAGGHWIKFEVSDEIKIPTWTAGDDDPVMASSPAE